jgi:hypothetical protein
LYKALTTGDEGNVYKDDRDDHTPMTFLSAQFDLSMGIDEYDIEVLQAEALESKTAAMKWTVDDVADIASRRMPLRLQKS